MAKSPIFVELTKSVDGQDSAPLKEVARHGRKNVLKVILMSWGIGTQCYTYQVFMVSYLVNVVGIEKTFMPKVLLLGAILGSLSAYIMSVLSDCYGRRTMLTILAGRQS